MSEPGEFRSPVKILLPKIREECVWFLGGCFLSRIFGTACSRWFSVTLCAALAAFMWLK